MLSRLTGTNEFSEREIEHLIRNVFDEADLDNDDAISFLEFEMAVFSR